MIKSKKRTELIRNDYTLNENRTFVRRMKNQI